MDTHRIPPFKHLLRDLLILLAGALSIYLLLTFVFPYHLAHRAQYTLPEGFPTAPVLLTFTITAIGLIAGILFRLIRLPWWLSYPLAEVIMLICVCHACDVNGRWFYLPKLSEEPLLAIDTEAYRGHWNQVQQLTQGNNLSDFERYYHNLALAHQGLLADSLMYQDELSDEVLFYPIDNTGTYMTIFAAGEVWWFVGNLTMAEHAAMLGMTFSPHHTGIRPLRRLYAINEASGNERSASKFRRILTEAGVSIPDILPLTSNSSQADTLCLSFQYARMLRSTLDRNHSNRPALEYLLCLDLIYKDYNGFQTDVERYGIPAPSRLYEEAMLILMYLHPELRETWHEWVNAQTYQEFCEFNNAIQQNLDITKMQAYRHTYWYYCQFINKK